MSQAWSIKIVPTGDTVRFDPDVFGIDPGQPLQAEVDDMVSWNNQTAYKQMISVFEAGSNTKSFSTEIFDSHKPSTPGYVIQDTDVDTTNPPPGAKGTVRYMATYMRPGTPPSEGPAMVYGTITVVNS